MMQAVTVTAGSYSWQFQLAVTAGSLLVDVTNVTANVFYIPLSAARHQEKEHKKQTTKQNHLFEGPMTHLRLISPIFGF